MTDVFQLVCPCLLGVEGLVADDLRSMGAGKVEPQNGRVHFEGNPEMLARANICSRYAERVLVQLGSFRAVTFEQLFQGVKALPWEDWIGKTDRFPVKGRSLNSKLASVPDCQAIIKKAIVERLKLKYKVPWFEETGNLYQVQFLLMKDQASIMIDTSGAGLHKRGYRANSTEAPIKETLAAAMAKLSRVRRDAHFIDPFCGSGTLLIEAALYAMNIAPGLRRRFAAEEWSFGEGVWKRERERAQDLVRRDSKFEAFGYDIDGAAVSLALENAKKAGEMCIRDRYRTAARIFAALAKKLRRKQKTLKKVMVNHKNPLKPRANVLYNCFTNFRNKRSGSGGRQGSKNEGYQS